MKNFISILFILLMSVSCSSAKKVVRPAWTNQTPSFNNDKTVLAAVGSYHSVGKEGRSWQMAELDARKKMTFVINTAVEMYQKSFAQTSNSEVVRHIFRETHQKGNAVFKKMDITKRWYDSKEDKYYVLVTVSFKQITKQIENKIKESKELKEEDKKEAVEALTQRSEDARKRLSEKLKDMKWE